MSFDFTIAMMPDPNMKLTREIQYVKSALLYADKIRLISPYTYFLELFTSENNQKSEKAYVNLLNQLISFIKMTGDIATYSNMKSTVGEFSMIINNKRYNQTPFTQRLKIKNELKKFTIQINDIIVDFIGKNQYSELKSLIDSKQIIIEKLGSLDNPDDYTMNYFTALNKSIRNSYPLFDEQSNGLLRAAVNECIIDLSEIEKQRIRHAGLADNYIQRLPSFEVATIDEIIDIKSELFDSIIRFRSKLLSYSENIQSLTWDNDFIPECSLLYDKEIAPAVLEIREATEENAFKKNLGKKFFTDEGVWKTTGGMIISIAAAGVIPSFTQSAAIEGSAIITGGAIAATKIYQAYEEYQDRKKEIEKKDLFFYYKAGELLSDY